MFICLFRTYVFCTFLFFNLGINLVYSQYLSQNDLDLLRASENGDSAEILQLINAGANVNASTIDGITPLMYACDNGHFMAAKILILNGADVNARPDNGITPLISAVKNGSWEIGELLIKNGADINKGDWQNISPLHYASAYGFYYTAEMLLFHGARDNIRDNFGNTPLHISVYYGDTSITRLLLDNKSQPNAQNDKGFSPLMIAAQYGYNDMVTILLENGADINLTNNEGMTPLLLSAANGHTELCKILIEKGSNIQQKNRAHYDALFYTRLYHYKETRKCLLKYGAKESYVPHFNHLGFGATMIFSSDNIFWDFHVRFQDPLFKIGLGGGIGFMPFARRVLVFRADETAYQYWETRSYAYLALYKHFQLFQINQKKYGLYTGIKNGYTWARYEGTEIPARSGYLFTPSCGIYRIKGFTTLSAGYEYANFSVYKQTNHWISVQYSILFPIKKSPAIKYQIPYI